MFQIDSGVDLLLQYAYSGIPRNINANALFYILSNHDIVQKLDSLCFN
jgi:hypothetical protein